MRAIFDGANGKSGSPYNIGSFYSATAGRSGTTWKLAPGSLSHDNPPLTDNAATTTPGGQPVGAWSEVSSLAYHVGIDPHVPAATSDVKISVGPRGGMLNPTLLTSKGTVWGAWFNSSGTAAMGYWTDQDPHMRSRCAMARRSRQGDPVALGMQTGPGSSPAYFFTQIRS